MNNKDLKFSSLLEEERPGSLFFCNASTNGLLRYAHNNAAGFTLIELLVVITIIAILGYMTSLSLGVLGNNRSVAGEADNIRNFLMLINEEAILQKKEIGICIYKNEIKTMEYAYDKRKWVKFDINSKISSYKLSDNVDVNVEIEGVPVVKDYSTNKPSIIFYSSGEATDFKILLSTKENKNQNVIAYENGKIVVRKSEKL